jgi:hypothetical protein
MGRPDLYFLGHHHSNFNICERMCLVNLVQLCFQKTHQSAIQATQKSDAMLHADHYASDQVRAIAESVREKWQQLMYHAEERHKLVMASMNWYKTAEQVRSSLGNMKKYFFKYVTHSGKRRLLGSNLQNKLLVWADSAQNYLYNDV